MSGGRAKTWKRRETLAPRPTIFDTPTVALTASALGGGRPPALDFDLATFFATSARGRGYHATRFPSFRALSPSARMRPLPRFAFALVILGALAALLPACGGDLPSTNYPHEKEYDPRQHEYVVGVADELAVTVWKMPDLSENVVVRPDGTITLPLIGELRALRKTPTQLVKEIRGKLAAYVKDDQAVVTVEVKVINSYRFIVSGQVVRPGPLTAKYYVTVSEALIMAGGATRFGSPERTVILRADGSGKVRRIPIDAKALAEGRHLEQDLAIVTGDTIVVP